MFRLATIPALALVLSSISPVAAGDGSGSHGLQRHDNPFATQGILGYFDGKTGTFKPVGTGLAGPDAFQSVTGKVIVRTTVTVASTALALKSIECDVFAGPSDTPQDPNEGRFSTVVVSGTTTTCNVAISYRWLLDPASDSLNVGLQIYGFDANGNEVRYHRRDILDEGPLPPSGGTATFNVAVTL